MRGRIDEFLSSNPGLKASDIPIEMITASGSGLDPHISRQGALIQTSRVAKARGVSEQALQKLIDEHTEKALFGMFGPSDQVNVLKLNLAVDELTASN